MHNLRFICLFLGLFLTACQDIRGINKQGGFRGEIRKGRSVVVSNRVIEGAVDFTALGEPVHAGINFSRVYLNGGVTFVIRKLEIQNSYITYMFFIKAYLSR